MRSSPSSRAYQGMMAFIDLDGEDKKDRDEISLKYDGLML